MKIERKHCFSDIRCISFRIVDETRCSVSNSIFSSKVENMKEQSDKI